MFFSRNQEFYVVVLRLLNLFLKDKVFLEDSFYLIYDETFLSFRNALSLGLNIKALIFMDIKVGIFVYF
ncbi:MAG TPA: hypothetical protein DIU37_05660 [Opitutae bacterium]|nr:hypothetical protein [Opitutae bacterium]